MMTTICMQNLLRRRRASLARVGDR
jgi:hypothetical protein